MKTKMIALLLIINLGLKAQDTNIFYYDVNPDYVITAPLDTFKIDINNDGLNDVAFYIYQSSLFEHYTKSLQPNSNYAYFTPTKSDSLAGTFTWRTSGSYWNSIDFDSSRIAVRLIDGSDYYYGWIRVLFGKSSPFPSGHNITIKEYAFCKIANYPFLFGQTTTLTAVNELTIDNNTQVYFNSSTANIVIQSDKQIKEVKLVNMLGANVVSYNNVNAASTNINTTNLAHGNYIVQVKFANSAVYAVQVAF